MDRDPDLILGVDRDLVEQFLILIRDKNRLADKANIFLEQTGQSGINIVITNQRDVLSHLVTFLSTPEQQNRDSWKEQITGAEEHFRRAIIEPYHIAFNEALDVLRKTVRSYESSVLPLVDGGHPELINAIDHERLRGQLKHINDQYERGRSAKALNHWNQEWEDRLQAFVNGYDSAISLTNDLDNLIPRAQAIVNRKGDRRRTLILMGISLFLGLVIREAYRYFSM